ncbi:MAG: hypothetical protein BroJett040_12700 [Oligoflexia bacterium]|nr:MAG: hypothetical protein BroJett040_12700 [Oligoflexia bacterium]
MKSKINELIAKIEDLQKELSKEYARLAEKYEYSFQKRKIIFLEQMRQYHIHVRTGLVSYVLSASIRNILSAPFIYAMIIPAVVLDLFLWMYQAFAFPLYQIPKVKRSDYIVFDRRFLSYLNIIEKVNCMYCTYVNGLFAYAVEIGGRTERYWCPIKAARKPNYDPHQYYQHFADYGDAETFKKISNDGGGFQKKRDSGDK